MKPTDSLHMIDNLIISDENYNELCESFPTQFEDCQFDGVRLIDVKVGASS